MIVAPPGWEEPAILLAEELGAGKVAACVAGGGARADSVRAGLHDVPGDALVVLVHDAARPLLSDEVIERLLTALGDGWDGVVPALPVADTIRRAHDGEAGETIGREGLISVQTPQAFAADALRRAFADRDVDAPDCAAVVQRAGGRVRIVEGEPRLLKVTTPADLELVASLL